MELLSVIRRWRYRQHFSIREIARRTGLSRNTVRKYLRCDSVGPKFDAADRPSRLDPFADTLAQMWRQEAAKSRKRKRTVKQLHADLTVLGYDGSYNRVAAFTLRAYPQQTHERLFDAHNHAFRVLGGAPRRGIYDNMRTAVDKVGRGKERKVNTRLAAMVSHFLFEAEFCNPASGWEKGQIEKNVQDARHRLWQPTPSFPSREALNAWLEAQCRALWAEIPHGAQPGAIADVWREEAQHLMQLPRPFDGFVEYARRVSPPELVEGAPDP